MDWILFNCWVFTSLFKVSRESMCTSEKEEKPLLMIEHIVTCQLKGYCRKLGFQKRFLLWKRHQLLNWLIRIELDFHTKRNHFFSSVVSIFFLFCLKVPNHWDKTLNYLFLPDLHFPIETHYRAAGRKEKEKRSSKNALLSPSHSPLSNPSIYPSFCRGSLLIRCCWSGFRVRVW